eukprot:6801341-Pyramimonas_sp.AAC.1
MQQSLVAGCCTPRLGNLPKKFLWGALAPTAECYTSSPDVRHQGEGVVAHCVVCVLPGSAKAE